MSTLDIPNNSAMMKRAEQLRRWEESDTNRAPPTPRHSRNGRHIKFSSGCVFLAACLSGDKDDVLQLIDDGADINTANVDGLTALHQACIDDKLDMVEFLVTHGADINRQDNEGWTPLHATASCGFVSIAQYLVEHNADVAAVNSDGDLALDLANDVQHMPMIDYMEKVVQERNIDVDQARRAEEKAMLNDANKWLLSDGADVDRPNPKTGATALHVAAAKGYTNVLKLLLAGRANVDKQDNDGWTALHAAAHWGQKETAEMLVDAWANMDIRNYSGQSCIDVADRKMVKFLEELRANMRIKRRPSSQISRISDAIENHVDKTPTKLVRVEVRTDAAKDAENVKPNQQIHAAEHAVEDEAPWRRKTLRTPNDSPTKNQVPDKELSGKSANESANDVILRRTHSFENDQKKPIAPATALLNAATTTPTTTGLSSPSTTVHTPPIRRNNSVSSPAAQSGSTSNNNGSTTASASASDVETPKPKQSAGNIFKNFFKSFVPPVRDEESETQRKAHAKRVRETRRSTQGVTLDEIKSAEELVKKKNLGMNKNNNNNNNNSSSNETSSTSSTATTTTTASTTTTTSATSSTTTTATTSSPSTTTTETATATTTTTSNSNNDNNSSSSSDSSQEPQPPPPPTTPPPSLIPTADDSEIIEAVVATLAPASSSVDDVNASFTLTAPTTRKSDDDQVETAESNAEEEVDDDQEEEAVSASYTIVSPSRLKTDPVAKQQTSSDSIESAVQPAVRPTELAIATTTTVTESKPIVQTPVATTPIAVLESPVRLRDKRSLSSATSKDVEADAKSDTASPVSTHADFNARDSLLSLYARRTGESGAGGASGASVAAATVAPSTSSSSSSATTTAAERRPSWRLKFDAGSKFKLEDITSGGSYPPNQSTIIPSAPAVMAAVNLASTAGTQRRISSGPNALNASNQSLNSIGRPVSAPSESINAYVTPPARQRYETSSASAAAATTTTTAGTTTATSTANNSASAASANHASATASSATTSHEDKDNDKENDNRTQTVIQRRRKPKRRSTGVVHLDMDELDPDRQHDTANNDNDEKEKESGSERTSRSRTASTATASVASDSKSSSSSDKAENGDGIDYKALWEAAKMENDKLKQMLKQKDDEVVQTRATLERFANATTKNSLSEIEKRERRAMERKLSELEEELKLLQKLKTENDRLRAENRALTRVVSKLTTSAQSQLAKSK
ncbi:protein phosphatase 1 regulatory subunit 12B isoform X9 [Drosophila sulfurigaster albostrigata]|uniref:protein phosphatase 1 regulatory subunit 12B isoform X9 n=1 Tax=Drosophila sulfurigaster albostrigata TaxID=89887 RepID=UPI002D21BC1C|nr:protein phosphatase 1 regulatory subunit 12B isoform X9 [Drosophila sulfurigaster albostrigata]